jgi:hypothetical protein
MQAYEFLGWSMHFFYQTEDTKGLTYASYKNELCKEAFNISDGNANFKANITRHIALIHN